MRSFLLFELCGPLASWGEEAVGEVRPTEARPTRSALLGLLGAALGLDRFDREAQEELARAVALGIAVEASGVPLIDYHTVQTRAPRRGRSFGSRAEQLAAPSHELNTLLSERHYRADVSYRVVMWEAAPSRFGLAALQTALAAPRFVLFLGRKSCPPSLPLAPRLVEAATIREALVENPRPADGLGVPRRRDPEMWLYWEGSPEIAGLPPVRSGERRDEPTSRRPWMFARRLEHAAVLPRKEAGP